MTAKRRGPKRTPIDQRKTAFHSCFSISIDDAERLYAILDKNNQTIGDFIRAAIDAAEAADRGNGRQPERRAQSDATS